jgi:uncharacterized membrane protein (Fun14 family)
MNTPVSPWQRVRSFLGLTSDGPWRAKTVLIAGLTIVAGLGLWLHAVVTVQPPAGADAATLSDISQRATETQFDWSKPMPRYVKAAISYIGGFFIGWTFRRFIGVAVALGVLILGLLAFGKYTGWDTSAAQEKVKNTGELVQREAGNLKDQLQTMLPSATAVGVGAFLGFRRRHRPATTATAKN